MFRSENERWQDEQIALFLLTPERVSDAYVDWLADPTVNRFLESRFTPQDRGAVEGFVGAALASDRDLFMGIRDKKSGRHVGNIKLGPIDFRHGLGEIGILVGDRAAWGRGIGRRAIAIVVRIAVEELKLRKLTAGCYSSNIGSRKAFESAGFLVEGTRPAHFLLDDQPEDLILMAWQPNRSGALPDA